jgi:hypothetical protein
LRARPALGVSVGEQQSHYCDTEQNKTDHAHGFFSQNTTSFGSRMPAAVQTEGKSSFGAPFLEASS